MCPIASCARWRSRPSIIAAPSSRRWPRGARRAADGLQDAAAGRHVPRVRHRRVGSRARQHAVARRPRAGLRDRRVRAAVGRGRAAGSASTSTSCRPTGAAASIRRASRRMLRQDRDHRIRAVLVVHNETSTGVDQPPAEIRRRSIAPGIRRCCSSTRCRRSASIDLRHDEWGIDVTLAGSQKGLMLPPGLELQRDQREGARRVAHGAACRKSVLGVGADAGRQRDRLLHVHAVDEPALRPARSAARCSTRKG